MTFFLPIQARPIAFPFFNLGNQAIRPLPIKANIINQDTQKVDFEALQARLNNQQYFIKSLGLEDIIFDLQSKSSVGEKPFAINGEQLLQANAAEGQNRQNLSSIWGPTAKSFYNLPSQNIETLLLPPPPTQKVSLKIEESYTKITISQDLLKSSQGDYPQYSDQESRVQNSCDKVLSANLMSEQKYYQQNNEIPIFSNTGIQDVDQTKLKLFKCKLCHKSYTNSKQLGGHVSSSHPGKSVAYFKKIYIRQQRSDERAALKKAKQIYFNKFGIQQPINRYQLLKIKLQVQAEQQNI